jgi:hypothetical protein
MAIMRDTYGNSIGRDEAARLRNKYGDWVLALYEGDIVGNVINDTYGNKVAEIRGGYIYDTSGNRLVEISGNRIYNNYGDWIFTID